MSKVAPVRLFLLSAAVTLALPALVLAEDIPPPAEGVPPPAEAGPPQAGPPPNFECAGEPVTGSGPGFSSSRDASEEAAIEAWVEKAKAIYPEAAWETAWEAGVSCVVQGLYSKCFAQGIPCRVTGDDEDAGTGAEAPDDSAQAPKTDTPKAE